MVSIIIPCKNRLNHLSSTYTLTRRLKGEIEVIIVDYKCPMGTADHFERAFTNQVKIVKAEVGDMDWNLSHARNLGYKASTGDVLLFIDADTSVKHNFLTMHHLNEGSFYTGTWLHSSGCCMVWRKDFEDVKGYNECVDGWGSEDYDLYRRLEGKGLRRYYFNPKLLKNMPHHDKIRNQYHPEKDIQVTNERNNLRQQKEFKSCIE